MSERPPAAFIKAVETIHREEWKVKREGKLDQVELENGKIQFRVKIWDKGRDAFITEWFNDIKPAGDFLERIKLENEGWFKEES